MQLNPSNDEIEQRACELWEKEGRPPGRELEFWLNAEREVTHTQNNSDDRLKVRDADAMPDGIDHD
jgi:hypothetical protein